ncbi:MAG: PEP-CTERM sorting domain-containing protein [Phycisphaerales bacterium]
MGVYGKILGVFGLGMGAIMSMAVPVSGATLSVTSGLILHLAPDSVTTDGFGNVTSWNDQSGLGNHATQGVAVYQPTLESGLTPSGADVVRFDSQDDADPEHLLIGANAADFDATAMTWFVVFRADLATNNRRMLTSAYSDIDPGAPVDLEAQAWGIITDVSTSPSDSGNGYRTLARTDTGGFNAASAGAGTPSALTDDMFVVGSSFLDTTTDEAFAMLTLPDGSQFTDSNTAATLQLDGHLQTLIGAQTGNDLIIDSGGWSGDIAAIVVYNRRLSTNEIATVTEELRLAYTVPEPASLALMALGVAGVSRRRY